MGDVLSILLAVLLVAFYMATVGYLIGAVFLASVRKRIAAHPFLYGIWFFSVLMLTVACVLGTPNRPRNTRFARSQATMAVLGMACDKYQAEYGQYPVGDNAAIVKALLGTNLRNISFLMLKSRDTNAVGEVIDPWGTPYRFKLQDGLPPSIQSAGPNRVFGDKDDILVPEPGSTPAKAP